jgi:hypothetical protein
MEAHPVWPQVYGRRVLVMFVHLRAQYESSKDVQPQHSLDKGEGEDLEAAEDEAADEEHCHIVDALEETLAEVDDGQ